MQKVSAIYLKDKLKAGVNAEQNIVDETFVMIAFTHSFKKHFDLFFFVW